MKPKKVVRTKATEVDRLRSAAQRLGRELLRFLQQLERVKP